MGEMYEIVHQATYRFFGIDELYKLVLDEMYEIGRYLRSLSMNTPEFALSQL